jgi:hypothetical protein
MKQAKRRIVEIRIGPNRVVAPAMLVRLLSDYAKVRFLGYEGRLSEIVTVPLKQVVE